MKEGMSKIPKNTVTLKMYCAVESRCNAKYIHHNQSLARATYLVQLCSLFHVVQEHMATSA